MKKLAFILLVFVSLLAFFDGGMNFHSALSEMSTQEKYVKNEVLAKFKKGTAGVLIQRAIEKVYGRIKTYQGMEINPGEWDAETPSLRSFLADPDLFQIKVSESIGTEKALFILNMNPNPSSTLKSIFIVF